MNILLVITNINGTYSDCYSFGLTSIASITRDKGFDYDYAVINNISECDLFFDLIEKVKPKIIAYTSVSSQFTYIKELSQKVRSKYRNDIIQVCGGTHLTIFPEAILETEGLDGCFIGEGELAFSDFLDKVANGLPYKNVKNFAYNDNGKLVKNDMYPLIDNLDELPFPERDKFGNERFREIIKYPIFMFARGCPFNCSYCCNHAIAKAYDMTSNKPRYRSVEKSIEEIKRVKDKHPMEGVYVVDDIFGLDKKWLKEFCIKYAEEIGLPLMCQLRVNLVDEERVKWLKHAGCIHVSCGIESGNDYIRNEVMKRNITKEQIINAYSLFKKYRIPANAINLIGVPDETIDSVKDTIELNRKINPSSSGVNIFYPYRGTDLGDYCFDKGLVDEEMYYNFSKERRASVLKFDKNLKDKLVSYHKNWLFWVYYRQRPLFLIERYVRLALHPIKNKSPRLWNIMRKLRSSLTIH